MCYLFRVEDQDNTMKRKITIAILIALLLPINVYPASDSAISALQYASAEMNKNLPRMVDSETELFSTSAYQDTVTYYNRVINFKKSELNLGHFRKTLIEQLTNIFCSYPDAEYYRDNDLKWKHVYSDKNDVYITTITTSVSRCSN